MTQHGWPNLEDWPSLRRSGTRVRSREVAALADAGCRGPRRRGDRPRRVDLCNDERIVKTAVVTAVHGRTAHLRKQLEGLAQVADQVDRHVVVAIDDDDVARTVRSAGVWTEVVPFRSATRRLPIAAARNLGAQAAIDDGAELLIFLDVDCIPAPNMVNRYLRAAEHPDHGDALLCGPVTYLLRPVPVDTTLRSSKRWSILIRRGPRRRTATSGSVPSTNCSGRCHSP